MTSLTLTLNPLFSLSDDQFFALCAQNQDLRFERTAQGELVVMSLAGSNSSQHLSAWKLYDKISCLLALSLGGSHFQG